MITSTSGTKPSDLFRWGGTLSALRFTLGVDSISGLYSDLGKATEILLWEV